MVTSAWMYASICLTCNKESYAWVVKQQFLVIYLCGDFPQQLIQTPSQLALRYLCYDCPRQISNKRCADLRVTKSLTCYLLQAQQQEGHHHEKIAVTMEAEDVLFARTQNKQWK